MTDLQPGDRVMVDGSYEGGRIIGFIGTVFSVKPSGTVLVDDETAKDGAGTPIRHYVSRGKITKMERRDA